MINCVLAADTVSSKGRLQAKWTAVVYAFYKPEVEIVEKNRRRAHKFHCAGMICQSTVTRYLDGKDSTSTSNLRKHARVCRSWGPEALDIAEEAGFNATETRKRLNDVMRSGSIEKAFERKGKGRITFSTRQHTREETRYVNGYSG